jgi:2-polyprenyl-3-methyl-5-hydroxy-6-metoxy-1,4-benzoquinol methylase
MNHGDVKTEKEQSPKNSEEERSSHWLFSRRGPAFLDPIVRIFDHSVRLVEPCIKQGQVVADIGCGWGYFSFALADMVGPEGKVYSVDLAKKCIRVIRKKAEKRGYHNIEAYASTAADLSFIPDVSVDFVFANGLLCSMAIDRRLAVNEMRRILKPTGMAYLSLGSPPPFGYVDQLEWEDILAGFKVEQGGSFKELWALVSL